MPRFIYEKLNIYIYIVVPVIVLPTYYLLNKHTIFVLSTISTYHEYKFEFVLTLLSVLLTVFGLMFSLPETKYRQLMRIYKHDEIINRTILIGILSCLIFSFLFLTEMLPKLQEYLFLIIFCETAISTVWIYMTLQAIGKERS
ncbi:hypothetical protein HMPREF9708_00111 [Facklamia languida CCUG 37842]|uniref:Uncharacterized protein n=1 Tax=Facklamia languida CCUG 37842 TaxID=883113 RepID=H3NGX2_9LACT|nr:hypothetical protein HMPREF9708_00111 [Facklamia languida CCUG 37842]